jgi:hypothetical protein
VRFEGVFWGDHKETKKPCGSEAAWLSFETRPNIAARLPAAA